jgi:Uma2 family endonuclease
MDGARPQDWSLEEFLSWEERQNERYEFVDGRPVMMTGGTQAHALIAANLISILRPMLRGSPCRPCGSDLRVPILATEHSRYPDVTIDCGEFAPDSHDASEPTIVFEVLSESTKWYDQTKKIKDYESVSTIRQYVCISQEEPRVSIWLKDADGRLIAQDDLAEADAELLIVGLHEPLRLTDIYEGTGIADKSTSVLGK